MKNKKLKIVAAVFAVILFPAILMICFFNTANDYSKALEANWKFSFPDKADCSMVYEKDSGPSFNGDGIRYHVYSYKNEEYIASLFEWDNDKQRTERYVNSSDTNTVSYELEIKSWLNDINVPEEYHPDYSDCKYYYMVNSGEINIAWDDVADKIYFVELFT